MAGILDEDVLLGLIKKQGGGSGGTSNYEDLDNKPKIAGTTLSGDKSLADLGLQGEMSAGEYINISEQNEMSVKRDISRDVDAIIEVSFAFPDCTVKKTIAGEVIDTVTFGMFGTVPDTVMDVYSVEMNLQAVALRFENIKQSKEQAVGYEFWVASYASGVVNTQTFEETLDADKKLIIQSELDSAVGDLTNLHTTAKDNAVAAINEVEDEAAALESSKTDTDMVAADFNDGSSYTAGNYCVQDGKLYKFKNNHSGAWSASDVEEVKITGELSALKDNSWSLGVGSHIAVNTDLNDITTVGNYYAVSQTAATLSHCPTTGAFKLKVLYDVRDTAPTYIEQVFNPISSYDEYRRYKSGSAEWSDWHLTNCNLDEIKSGILQNGINLEVPNRKNLLPITLSNIKKISTGGTWNGNEYTYNGVTFTIVSNADGYVERITANGTAQDSIYFKILDYLSLPKGKYILSGGPSTTCRLSIYAQGVWKGSDSGSGLSVEVTDDYTPTSTDRLEIVINSGYEATDVVFTPMVRPSFITDATFAPYIPSVDSRLDGVESGLNDIGTYGATPVKIGKWFNHDLYRLAINCGTLPNNTALTVPTGLQSSVTAVKVYGIALANANCVPMPNPLFNIRLYYDKDNNQIVIETDRDLRNYTGYVTIEYYS